MNSARIHRALERELSSVSYAIDVMEGRSLPLSDVQALVLKCLVLHAVRLTRAVCYLQRRLSR